MCAFAAVLCLMWGLTPAAEGISVKLRGKIALAGILSGLAYTTHVLVTRDRRAAEELQLRFGPPERVVRFERGFDVWRIDYYRDRCYLFRNNRLINLSCSLQDVAIRRSLLQENRFADRQVPFLIDTPVLAIPRSLRLFRWHLRRVPLSVSSGLYLSGDGRLLDLEPWLSR